ncbi:unnamed protein product [Oikopleura dioica]|uniref:Uncharacterized protein n=1 Tax=Oikopleura dioica TaxID=34765 RepID=E4WUU7_OIKDI|nr:unnamed protein product [Oikopleura dioica]CBY34374.1 unnamed protein product [Oikopleura dioica]
MKNIKSKFKSLAIQKESKTINGRYISFPVMRWCFRTGHPICHRILHQNTPSHTRDNMMW